jgi:hypothetical protein
MTYNNVDTPYYRSAIRQSKQGEPLLEKAKEDYESLDIDPRTGFLAVPIDQDIFSYSLVPFQKSDDDEENHIQIENLQASPLPNAADAPSPKKRQKHKEPTTEPRRTLRGTPGRGSQGSSQPPTPNGDTKPLTPTSDQSPGLRTNVRTTTPVRTAAPIRTTAPVRAIVPARVGAPVRTGFKPEAPKLKTATLTRADMARAREQTGERVELEAEDELLEKLKLKSKKSRSLANSLQSRLKPSIVDKAVVINKKAPKGWAYVVVEGEEDTTEGEDGDDEEQASSTRASSSAPGQSLPDPLEPEDSEAARLEAIKEALREENRRKSREKASLKKLAQEAKIKDRAEKYQIHKAEKARLQAETLARRARGEETSEDETEKKESSKPVTTRSRRGAGKISVDVSPPAPDQAQTKLRSQPGSPSEIKPQVNGGQRSSGSSPRDETAEGSAGKRKAGTPEDAEQQQESSEKSTESSHKPATKRNSVSERPSKAKRRAHGDVEKHRLEEDGDANGGDKGEESDVAERSEESEAVQAKEEPPRKRQKKAGLGRSSPPGEPDDESGAGNPRRLRSQETTPLALNATALGPRRSSLAGPRGSSTKGSVDSTSGEYQHQHPSAV